MTDTTTSSGMPAISDDDRVLGTVAQSHSQMDYVVEVYRDRDRDNPPEKQEYEFGQPVYATVEIQGTSYALVGVVYDSQLVDPDQGREGPRLSTPDQETFVPSYIDEKRTLLGVAVLGYAEFTPADGGEERESGYNFATVEQSMPRWTLDIDDPVLKLSPEGFRQFHFPPTNDSLQVQYYDRLVSTADRFGAEVALRLLERLREETDARDEMLGVIEQKIRWEMNTDRGVIR